MNHADTQGIEPLVRPPGAGAVLPVARYQFHFRMHDDLRLPEYAGSLLRGQFGSALRRTACITGAKQCTGCPLYQTCPYPAIFETPAPESHPLQVFSQVPNPYVIEPPPLGTRHVPANEELVFNVVLVGRALAQLPLIAYALQRAFQRGAGKLRARAAIEDIRYERPGGTASVWDAANSRILAHEPGLMIPALADASEITLKIATPLRLQNQGRPLSQEDLRPRTLFTALLRRASLLFEIHAGIAGVVGDAAHLATLAEELTEERALRWQDWTRFSSRQQQEMTLGGVVGEWKLCGDLKELLPWFWLGQWLHVGKNATMGMGRYTIE